MRKTYSYSEQSIGEDGTPLPRPSRWALLSWLFLMAAGATGSVVAVVKYLATQERYFGERSEIFNRPADPLWWLSWESAFALLVSLLVFSLCAKSAIRTWRDLRERFH